ncbi:hypothetical protein [Psychrobacter immobilis]|uniref:hypothetical protein n=1 Tax=Psychrobacter immobilis TaxID=498 RepID=UPI00191A0828|nr:hypothetical protein [Psychrobacter immobilis]
MTSDGVIELPGIIILFACIFRCAQYVIQSQLKLGQYFWLASVLVFFAVIRRELNYVPELFIPSNFSFLNHPYAWWEDAVLLTVYLLIVGLLAYSWRYLWTVLKKVPVSLYIAVVALALLEYMGENAIFIPENMGEIVEEIAETSVYAIALIYLWRFKLVDFESHVSYQLQPHEPCKAN